MIRRIIANQVFFDCNAKKKKMNASQFNAKYGKNAIDVLTVIYSTASINPLPSLNYSRLLNQDICENVDVSPRTVVDILDRLENDNIIHRQFNAKYRQIFVNESLPDETQVLLENNLERLKKEHAQKINQQMTQPVFA